MYTTEELAELADICYITIEKECAKPLEEINTSLVDACIELADLLLGIKPLSQEELDAAKQKIKAMTVRRRKSLRVRIIAAVIAALLLLGTTVYAFSDWIVEVFGIEALQTIEPGDRVTVEQHDLEAPSDIIHFDTIDELLEYVDQPIYLPSELPEGYELKRISIDSYEEKRITLLWNKNAETIRYMISINPSYFNEKDFESHDYEHYSKDKHPFDIIQNGTRWQAMGWIDNNEYIILANNTALLKEFIDNIVINE